MKRLLLLALITMFYTSNSLASGAPLRVSSEQAYNQAWNYYYPKIIITSTENSLTIKKVTVNKGNCKFSNSDMAYINGRMQTIKLTPRTLKYGEKIEIRLQKSCQLLRVDVDTDQGSWSVEY